MSAEKFLITGLPRTRAAWLSVFCTTGQSICYHEPSTQISDLSELDRIFASDFYKHVGIADSGLGFFLDWILENIKPRTLIVDRDPAEVTELLVKLGVARSNYADLLHEKLMRFKSHPLVMWVPMEALQQKRVMQKVYWHLMPGEAFDEVRYEQLSKMTIEADPTKVVNQASQGRPAAMRLLAKMKPYIRLVDAGHESQLRH